jgi:uncharacterized protein YyaL (SSP411 family)
MERLIEHTVNDDYSVLRLYNKTYLNGFLDDYAFLVEALIYSYEASFNKKYLDIAINLVTYTNENFFDNKTNLFYYTSVSNKLIARKIEFSDNVIPSSNGVMAMNLWRLGHLLSNKSYTRQSRKMLEAVRPLFGEFKMYFAVWHQLEVAVQKGQIEVAVTGPDATTYAQDIQQYYWPFTLFYGGTEEDIPQLAQKVKLECNQIFICQNYTCSKPITNVKESLEMLKAHIN